MIAPDAYARKSFAQTFARSKDAMSARASPIAAGENVAAAAI
jgi:hypothetical protein